MHELPCAFSLHRDHQFLSDRQASCIPNCFSKCDGWALYYVWTRAAGNHDPHQSRPLQGRLVVGRAACCAVFGHSQGRYYLYPVIYGFQTSEITIFLHTHPREQKNEDVLLANPDEFMQQGFSLIIESQEPRGSQSISEINPR